MIKLKKPKTQMRGAPSTFAFARLVVVAYYASLNRVCALLHIGDYLYMTVMRIIFVTYTLCPSSLLLLCSSFWS